LVCTRPFAYFVFQFHPICQYMNEKMHYNQMNLTSL
jgi:hypothetical protein